MKLARERKGQVAKTRLNRVGWRSVNFLAVGGVEDIKLIRRKNPEPASGTERGGRLGQWVLETPN